MALEGQTFQFNMGAADPLPTKMDISLDDMIKQVSELQTRAPPPASASSLGFLSLHPANTTHKNFNDNFFYFLPACLTHMRSTIFFLLFSQTNGVRFAFAGIQGGARKEEGCRRREGQEGGTFRLPSIANPPPPHAFQEGFCAKRCVRDSNNFVHVKFLLGVFFFST